jgi:hypothetical protein
LAAFCGYLLKVESQDSHLSKPAAKQVAQEKWQALQS